MKAPLCENPLPGASGLPRGPGASRASQGTPRRLCNGLEGASHGPLGPLGGFQGRPGLAGAAQRPNGEKKEWRGKEGRIPWGEAIGGPPV